MQRKIYEEVKIFLPVLEENININESNEVLVTSFTTHATPLIRYQIGDAMELDENTNKVYSILGRKSDFLFSTNGDKINIANISNIFKMNLVSGVINHLSKNKPMP